MLTKLWIDMNEEIKDLIWEWDNGTISPYDLVKKLKDITNDESWEN